MIFQKQLLESLQTNSLKTAIEYNGEDISYDSLLTEANRITQFLLSKKLEKEIIIGIELSDRANVIASIIGVVNARCVFVLLDRSLPASRMEHLIQDLGLQYVISTEDSHPSLVAAELPGHWRYDEIQQSEEAGAELAFPEPEANDSLYVYYTSGSTGTPKGILGKNCSLLQFLLWEIEAFEIDGESRFSQFISPYFDAFLRDVFVPLLAGGTVCIPPASEDFFSPENLISWIDSAKISSIHCVPSLFRVINNDSLSSSQFENLKHVLLSGEKINPSELTNWYETFGDRIQLANFYGATETTMIRTCYKIAPEDVKRSRMPIGSPIADTELLIARKNMQPCSALVPGDLYIISNYLSKGYWNQPELTSERFIKINEGTAEETIAYKTGDKARKLAQGQIELLGREDRQVKLRGIRIELDEVEVVLMKSGLLQNATVLVHTEESGQDSLVAFLIKKDATQENSGLEADISRFMADHVPAYMIPSNTVFVEEYPLLPNGKINLKGLLANLTIQREMVLPVNEVEEKILAIWKDILGERNISTDDLFHKIGGNSLSLMSLIARINKEFQIRISLSELFKNATIQKQAAFIENNNPAKDESGSIPVAAKADHYVLSSAQKRLFFLYRFDPKSLAYNMPSVFKLEGELSKDHIQSVFEKLIAHYEILRTAFEVIEGEPVQSVAEQVDFEVESFSANEKKAPVIIQKFIRPFDLSAPCLMRVGLIETALNEHLLMVDFHHIISDGVSQEILIKEFMTLYKGETLSPPKLSYKDFAVWQQSETQQQSVLKQSEFWHEEFSQEVEMLDLPTDFARPAIKSHEGNALSFELSKKDTAKLESIAESEGATMFMVILSVYNILLARLCNQEDIVVGTPVAGRHQPELEDMLGMFVNTLSLRNSAEGDLSYKSFLSSVKAKTLACLENQDYPYEELIEVLKVERDTSRNPLFDVMFAYANYEQTKLEIPELSLSQMSSGQLRSKFDMTLYAFDKEGKLHLNLEYATALFKTETIERFVGYFKQIVSAIIDNVDTKIADIEILTESEKAQLLTEFNNCKLPFDTELTINALFEKAVAEHGDKTAVICKGQKLTYAELDERSNQVAHSIQKQAQQKSQFVGILMERSLELLVSIMGVLKAGCAYVPIDPEYPISRIEYIAGNSELEVILTSDTTQEIADQLPGKVRSINVSGEELKSESSKAVKDSVSPSSLAYLIYTSGSTGMPKGVMVNHRNVVNLFYGMIETTAFGKAKNILSLTTSSFDVFVSESIVPLLNGQQIVLASNEEQKDTRATYKLLRDHKIDCFQITPSHFKLLIASNPDDLLRDVKVMIVAGEAFPIKLLKDVQVLCPEGAICNMYGPTEATVYATYGDLSDSESMHIGHPVTNGLMRILDNHKKLLPVGVAGDLYIGGEGVSQGYWANKKLTDEKFIPDPVTGEGTLYQTGDRARWLPDGNIEFLGRNDNQVKLSGNRIELGEIESQLATLEQIEEAVVLVKERGENKFLTAYYQSEKALERTMLRGYLKDKLPAYMLPSYYIHLERFPLTPNGKLDKKALPDPEVKKGDEFTAPSNATEEKLVALWSETLEVKKEAISVDSSFFELGGHSILAIKLIGLIQDEFGVTIGLPDFFKDPSIGSIALKIVEGSGDQIALPKPSEDLENRYEPFPLTSVQQAYLMGREDIFEYGSVGTHMYSESFLQELDVDQFNKVLQGLIDRHEMLRMVITPDGKQRILEEVPPYEVKVLDLNEWSEEEGEELFYAQRKELSHQVFTGEEWPLFDIRVTKFTDGTYKIHYSVDALMLDASSAIIIKNDFAALSGDVESALAPIPISFRDYVLSEEALKGGELFEKSKQYWVSRVEDMPFAPDLPLASAENLPAKPTFERHLSHLDKPQWDKLQEKARGLGITPTVLLLGCFSEVLNRWSKSSHFSINLTLFNRIPFHKEVDKIVGDFTSLTLLEVDFRKEEGFSSRLQGIQNRLWEDLEHKYFGGVDMLREMSRYHGSSVIVPVVITSTLGLGNAEEEEDQVEETFELNKMQEGHSITQTPQVWIDFQLGDNKDGLWYLWDSIEGLFPAGMMDQMFAAFEDLLASLAKDEKLWNSESLVLLPNEQREAREAVNDTTATQSDKYLHELFADQAAETPDRIAVITDDKQFTYGEINAMSLALGSKLRSLGTAPNQLVGIVMEKCWEQVVASFGIIYSGAAYLPIGAELPEDRIMLLLEQGEADIVVTTAEVAKRLSFPDDKKVVLVDESLKDEKQPKLKPIQALSDLAYVIFTSGSTGMPKGVMIDHIGAVNTVIDINERFNVGPEDRVLAISSLSFDLSVYDIFGMLAVGGAMVIPRQDELRSPDRWMEYVQQHQVTLWNTVPALMQMMVDYNREREQLPLRLVMMSGDWIPINLPARIKAINPGVEVFSLGGATEASIWSIYYPIEEVESGWKSIPYGKPLKNQGFHVLKSDYTHCPDYVPGDLYITGIGLAKGYWKDAEKTAASFITHPETEERLYKTGDLGRYLPDGNIEFLGREDNQIKIQGFRIELGEIEYQMNSHAEVKEAVVLAKENKGEKYLVAYYQSDSAIALEAFNDFLSRVLPSYMIPSYYVHLEAFPLTPNGKVSLKLLPEPEIQARPDYVAPTNDTHQKLVAIWSQILNIDEEVIGINRSFFDLGGHSLKAMEMVNQVREELDVEIPLRVVFEQRDIEHISEFIPKAEKSELSRIERATEKEAYALTSVQKRLFFLYELNRASLAYNNPYALRVSGSLDKEKLDQVFSQLIARHEALRTSFGVSGDQPAQMIAEEATFRIEHFKGREEDIAEIIESFVRPFDLYKAPLMRIGLVELASEDHIMIVDTHHIITDGISQGVLIQDFMKLYNGDSLPEVALHYKDYAEWQQTVEWQQAAAKQKEYWVSNFREQAPALELPVDFARPAVKKFDGATIRFNLDDAIVDQLKALAKQEDATMFMVMLAVYNVFLSKLSKQEDLTVGISLAGRRHADVESMIGMFANALPLRNKMAGDLSFTAFLEQLKSNSIAFFDNQDYPYEQLVEDLSLERDTSRNPLFDTLFFYQNYGESALEIPGVHIESYEQKHTVSKFDLSLSVFEVGEGIALSFEYATALFKEETVETFIKHFRQVVSTVLSDSEVKLKEIDLLPAGERQQLLVDFNDTQVDFPTDKSYVNLFEEQVSKTPDQTAVNSGNIQLTYGELNDLSTDLALAIIEQNSDSLVVGLFVEPTAEMLIGILGILKAGKAFLPLDPKQPKSRLADILEDVSCEVIVTTDHLAKEHVYTGNAVIVDSSKKVARFRQTNVKVSATDLAYVIYTSGSTGKPKGVQITHANLVNYVCSLAARLKLQPEDKSILTSSFVFDLGYSSIFTPLVKGAAVHVVGRSLYLSPEDLLEYIDSQGISYLKITPSLLKTIVNAANFGKTAFDNVRHIVIGGEALVLTDVQKVLDLYPDVLFIDEYGPTETTVGVIAQEIHDINSLKAQPSIGKPISNTKVFILDKGNNLLPLGAIGELCIGGASVGAGYVNNPALNAEKFIDSPFQDNEKIYKTGDLAKWLPDGRIVFLGRSDNQVKIRGFRVEPDEIAIQLRQHEAIKDAAIVVKGDEDKYLAAYYVADSPTDRESLQNFLSLSLPEYMVPAAFMGIDEMPLTANGKLDVKALPEPYETKRPPQPESNGHHKPAQADPEAVLLKVWSEVLRSDNISVTDNFFSIGGDSIKCILICSKMKNYGYDLSIEDVLTLKTIQNIAKKLGGVPKEEAQSPKAEELLLKVWSEVLKSDNITVTDNFFSIGGDSIKCILICSRMKNHGYDLSIEDVLTHKTIQNIAKKLEGVHKEEAQSPKVEELLLKVWSEVLKSDNIRVTDNFFSIGGDSIKCILICSKMKNHGYDLSIEDVLTLKTIQNIAKKLEGASNEETQSPKVEELLLKVWSEVLKSDNITVTDNFFSIGGDSIKCILICSKMKNYGYDLSIEDVLTHKTIQNIARNLTGNTTDNSPQQNPEKAPLSPIQAWFFDTQLKHEHHFNQSVMLEFEQGISQETVEQVFGKIWEHHDALRMVFKKEENGYIQQVIGKDFPLALEVHDLRDSEDTNSSLLALANSIQAGIDLHNGPLLKLGLFQMQDADRLLIVIHHLVIDAVSWRFLFEDIESLLKQVECKEALTLPGKTDAFLNWAWLLQFYAQTDSFKQADDYWTEVLATKPASIPRDFPEGIHMNENSKVTSLKLDKSHTSKLLSEVHSRYQTRINDLLLAALVLSIKEQFGHEQVSIDLEGHGRESIDQGENISRTVGWFTSIYPVRLPYGGENLGEALKAVKDALGKVPNNGLDYLLKRYVLDGNQASSKHSGSQILFNYLGQFDSDIDDKSFKVTQESTGRSRAEGEIESYDWDLSGMIVGGELTMELKYSQAQYREETATAFMALYKKHLEALIHHCSHFDGTALTPVDFTYQELSEAQVKELTQTFKMTDIYPLSPMQEGMLFHALLDPESEYYFEQITCHIEGKLDAATIEESMNVIMARYDILRTIFLSEGYERPLQMVLKENKIEFEFVDAREECRQTSKEEVVDDFRAKQNARKFDLSTEVPMRMLVLQTDDEEFKLIWAYHHILMDGWCIGIIASELTRVYTTRRNGISLTLPHTQPYSRYIQWIESRNKKEALNFWKNYLKGYESQVGLPRIDAPKVHGQLNDLKYAQLRLDKLLTAFLPRISADVGVTLNGIIQCAWAILMGRYNNTDDVVFGAVVSGRPAEMEGMENMVGLFINTVPVRIKVDPEMEVAEMLQQSQRTTMATDQYHYNPLSDIQAASPLGTNLISAVMVFENYPVADQLTDTSSGSEAKEEFTIIDVEFHEPTNYDLIVFVNPGEELIVRIDYNANVYSQETVEACLVHLHNIIREMALNTRVKVKDIPLLTEQEQKHLVHELNQTNVPTPEGCETVLDLFRKQAQQTPENIALRFGDESVTYQQLDAQTDKLAAYLLASEELRKGDLVALVMDRQPRLILAMLGVMKAGAAYLPIEPAYPAERKAMLIANSQSTLVITDHKNQESLPSTEARLLNLEEAMPRILQQSAESLDVKLDADQLAYVIYTSGSTGQPKGVMVHHHAMLNFVNWSAREYSQGQENTSSFALNSSIAFDLTVTVIYSPLVTGNAVVIYAGEDKTTQIQEVLEDGQANIIKLTPTHLKLIRDSELTAADLKNLNTLIVGGEELTHSLMREVYDQFDGQVRMFNEYGPTEATVTCMNLPIDPDIVRSVIPIGAPIDNTQTYVLDRYLNPVPVGVEGELYIAGDNLAMGYLNAEELTREKFIDNPFVPGKKMYKTGDLAKVNSDGHLVFAGRIDDQVKIRGYRIELGEIETHLASHEQLNEVAVAIKQKSGDQFIVAYYQAEEEIEASVLVAFLQPKLPNHMIPSFFVRLEEFPVTNSGKLNRKALPDPELGAGNGFEAPANDIEKRLVDMWSEVLSAEVEMISVTRSFFELGGHSLNSIRLVNKIAKGFGIMLSLNDVFVHQTVRKLGKLIEISAKSTFEAIPKAAAQAQYPLSQAQMPLYFRYELDPDSLVTNLSYIVEIKGGVDKAQLQHTFNKLVERHESLRTSFQMSGEGPVQVVAEQVEFEVNQFKADEEEASAILNDFVKPFDISQAPLMRAGLIETNEQSHILIVDVHHLVADGLSVEVIKRDFVAIYNAQDLSPLEIQYTDFVMWEAGEAYQAKLQAQKQYWLDEFSEEIQPLEVPLDYERPDVTDNAGEVIDFSIGTEKSQQLKALAEAQGVTSAIMVVSIFNIFLSKLARQEDIIIGMPLSGREQTELEAVLGMFAKVLPVRNQPSGELSFVDFLAQVKDKFSKALDHQGYPYEDLAMELGIQRNSGRNPWFDVMLEYQHFEPIEEPDMAGLEIREYGDKSVLIENNLGLHVLEAAEEIYFGISYSKALFRKETVDKFIEYFKQITDTVLENPEGLISQIDIVEGEEREKLLFEFNGPTYEFDREKTYPNLFKEQVLKSPDSIAVTHNGDSLSYQQLYEKSIDLASYLLSKGVSNQTKVGIFLPRSIDMLVSILGTLQAGSAYVPIDIYYPEKRIDEIVKDSEVSVIITNGEHKGDLDQIFESTPTLETVFDISQLPLTRHRNGSTPAFEGTTSDLAYMIFTSGTTGKPKGVMIHQLGMINHLNAKINDLDITASDVIAQTASPCFDISVWQFLAALMVGGKTYIIDKEKVVYPDSLCEELQQGEVSIFESVPSLMTNFLDDLPDNHDLSLKKLRWMVPTGEALSVALARKWYEYFPEIKLLNAYGPTEASDDITHYVVEPESLSAHVMPIGKPLANTRIFILNEHLGLCPIGVRGEICVAGLGVGKGYWQNEEKTNEVFVPNPFVAELDDPDYATLYKTGDIGYFREDGNVIYVGRKDDQLKINGNRVELGEIESRLSLHEAIKEAAVVAKGEGTKQYLAAYYVAGQQIDQKELKVHMVDQLPDYMIPAVYVALDKMPLTANGKLNRQALPDPDFTLDDDFTKASTVTEIKLCEIWSEVLKIDNDKVSVTADFFSLGGNSLMSINLIGKIHKEMNVKLTLRDFFADPSVRATAEYIDSLSWLSEDSSSEGKNKVEITI